MAKKSTRKATTGQLSPEQAEEQAKLAARKRQIVIELTDDQLKKLTAQWKKLKPAEAAELVFQVAGKQTSAIKVAGYSYHGNTCCV